MLGFLTASNKRDVNNALYTLAGDAERSRATGERRRDDPPRALRPRRALDDALFPEPNADGGGASVSSSIAAPPSPDSSEMILYSKYMPVSCTS